MTLTRDLIFTLRRFISEYTAAFLEFGGFNFGYASFDVMRFIAITKCIWRNIDILYLKRPKVHPRCERMFWPILRQGIRKSNVDQWQFSIWKLSAIDSELMFHALHNFVWSFTEWWCDGDTKCNGLGWGMICFHKPVLCELHKMIHTTYSLNKSRRFQIPRRQGTVYWHWLIISIMESGMKLLIHSQTSTASPLNFRNG